jgi:hypothetical protein
MVAAIVTAIAVPIGPAVAIAGSAAFSHDDATIRRVVVRAPDVTEATLDPMAVVRWDAVPPGLEARATSTTPGLFFVAPSRGIGAAPGSSYNPTNLGQSYGSATVVPRPDIGITGFRGSTNPADPFHALDRAIDRGVSPETILDTVRSPAAVLQQTNGRYLYLGQRGAVVLDDTGQVVTVWNRSDFNATNEAILADALGGG